MDDELIRVLGNSGIMTPAQLNALNNATPECPLGNEACISGEVGESNRLKKMMMKEDLQTYPHKVPRWDKSKELKARSIPFLFNQLGWSDPVYLLFVLDVYVLLPLLLIYVWFGVRVRFGWLWRMLRKMGFGGGFLGSKGQGKSKGDFVVDSRGEGAAGDLVHEERTARKSKSSGYFITKTGSISKGIGVFFRQSPCCHGFACVFVGGRV